jgi:hypothetical protein
MTIQRWPSKYIADRLHSWITRQPFYEFRNPWMMHDGTKWFVDPVWDKCFPKFEAASREEAIRKYCLYYYEEAARLIGLLPDRICYVDTEKMDSGDYQAGILTFLGIPASEQVFTDAHIHRSKPVPDSAKLRAAQPRTVSTE